MYPRHSLFAILALCSVLLPGWRSATAVTPGTGPSTGADSADAAPPVTEAVGKGASEKQSSPPLIAREELAPGAVRIEIFEHAVSEVPDANRAKKSGDEQSASWANLPQMKTDEYAEPAFGLGEIVQKYDEQGIRMDRSDPFLVRAAAVVTLPRGECRLLVRSLSGARLAMDGQQLATTEILQQKTADVEPVPDQAKRQLVAGLPLLPPGHREAMASLAADGEPHVFTLEVFVGGKAIRPELGQVLVAVSHEGKAFRLLGGPEHGTEAGLTDRGWREYAATQAGHVLQLNAARRQNDAEQGYWRSRHALAKEHAGAAPAVPAAPGAERGEVDRFIDARLAKAGVEPSGGISDAAFLRRVTLDTTGLVPTSEEVTAFAQDPAPDKRARAIDRLLASPHWADRWVPYWQDVLAENPAMLKASLANSGPFRWWIYEALLDNKPMDRFATELIAMRGSTQGGGSSGFAVSSQNDLPMASKAQIVGSAFLAMDMKCARCHDAPNHPFNQEDLFNLAAMLQRSPVKVPGTSLATGLRPNSQVVVSLKAGQSIDPHWPFRDLQADPLPGLLRHPEDTREQLAAILTDPRQPRFAQVIANRLWKELLGWGIVDPVEDWENTSASHPELLAWLGHELVTHDYDLKHLARLIFNSAVYQRAATAAASGSQKPEDRLFAAPARRRMTAEELVDSLFALCGKDFESEPLTMDPEDRQAAKDHSNLGVPRRAWQFTGLANERDRPALAKPRAQVVADVLTTFGWRESRAEPRSVRDHEANVLQPALLANGTMGGRITRLDDSSALTELALKDQGVEELVSELFRRILSREPAEAERARFRAALEPGYESRRTGAPKQEYHSAITKAVSWANHLNPDATNVILAVEKEVKAGEPPTARLTADWRERMEDVLWALMLAPEFIYLP